MAKLSKTVSCDTSRGLVYANLILSEGDYDIENNRSPINWSVTLTTGRVGWSTSWAQWGTKIYVTGSIGGQSIGTIYIPNYNYNGAGGSGTSFGSGTIWITHNNDGTKSIDASISFVDNADGNNNGTYYTPGDGSNTAYGLVLNTIPRASTPSMGTATMNSAITITTNRASSSFTHTLTYKFGSATGTIGTAKAVGASVSWTPPISLADQVPNATSGTGTITCDTYNGSTHIGTKSITFTANVPTSVIPTISSVGLSDGNTIVTSKSIGYFVQNKSYGVLAVSSNGAHSSTIKTFKLTIAGTTYTENSVANINSKLASLVLPVGDSLSYSVVVTDSRGRSSSAKTGTYTVKAYSQPSITGATAYRSNSSGVAADSGTYINAQIAGSISTVGGKNKCTVKIGYKLKSNTSGDYTWTTYVNASTSTISVDYTGSNKKVIGGGNISANSTYLCQVYISDLWDSNTRTFEISTGFDLIHYHKSGKALAIGKKSEATDSEEKLEIALKTEYKGNLLAAFPVGAIYLSTEPTNPTNYFGGTWTQLKNAYLFATNATSGNKGTGSGTGTDTGAASGSTATTVLETKHLPSHTHTASAENGGAHTHNVQTFPWGGSNASYYVISASGPGGNVGSTHWTGGFAVEAGSHSHTITIGSTGSGTGHSHGLNSHKHTVPYLEVYVWKRTG